MGDKNIFTTYEGQDGIKIGSFPRRLLLSWVMKDYKMLLSSDITSESQVLMRRQINQGCGLLRLTFNMTVIPI